MTLAALFTLAMVVVIFILMAGFRFSPDTVLFGALAVLLTVGIVTPADALKGFSNEGVFTVGILFVVAAGLRESGAMVMLMSRMLGRTRSIVGAQARIMLPVAGFSAFWNNTPLVAVLLPAIQDWSRKQNLPASKFLIPLSYAAILGGMCTIIGTSTNLVVQGLVIGQGREGFGFFEIGYVGLPVAIAGMVLILLTSRWLLPDHGTSLDALENPREYTLEMVVEPGGPMVGRSLEEANLEAGRGVYLMELERNGRTIDDPQPTERLEPRDILYFITPIDNAVDLQAMPGLVPATDERLKLDGHLHHRCLVEAVVSDSSPMIDLTISEGRFRSRYDAVVIGVARNGQRIEGKLGDIVIRPGDTLLLEALPSFVERYRNSRDFYLVSQVEGYSPPRHDRAPIALAILLAMVALAISGVVGLLQAAMLAAGAMLMTNCISPDQARRSVDWRILTTIATAFGIGAALESSGAARSLAMFFSSLAGDNPLICLLIVYLTTAFFTEIITNNAAVVLVFPIAQSLAQQLGADLMPFAAAIMIAGSSSFATPIGYQTNLMVYGAGGYRFSDFFRIGIPLDVLACIVALCIIPWIWPFFPA